MSESHEQFVKLKRVTVELVAKAGKTLRYGVRAVHREGGASPLATTGMVQMK